jgi:hypothetical protein
MAPNYKNLGFDKKKMIEKLALFFLLGSSVLIFLLYNESLSPSIAGGDSGEVVAEGCHLGTAHPPGYPLMTMMVHFLSKLATLEHSVAFWVNISSALFTSAACLFIGLTVYEYSGIISGGVLAGFLFAFSPLIWQYAITAEVFPMNTAFAALVVYLTVRFTKTAQNSLAFAGALVCGLALCNQHTIILYEAPLVLWMLILLRKRIYYFPKLFYQLSAAFFLGFSGYLYLPIAAFLNHRPGSWGYVATISGFFHHFLRKDYGTFQLFSGNTGRENEQMMSRNLAYWKDLSENQIIFPVVYLLFVGIIISIFYSLKEDKSYAVSVDMVPVTPRSAIVSQINKQTSSSTSAKKAKKGSNKNSSSEPIPTVSSTLISDETTTKEMFLVSETECRWTPFVFVLTEVFYICVFHSLSNLPLSDKLLYGVHQRFWMQPNILVFIWIGIGFNSLFVLANSFFTSSSTSTTALHKALLVVIRLLLILGMVYFSHQQYSHHYDLSNQKTATFFKDYAKSILKPLPPNSILLINYDQQWTSTRYLQICEHYRPDVITLQLSMMSYKWFEHKRSLYQNLSSANETDDRKMNGRRLTFPGKFLTYEGSPSLLKENAFTLVHFLNENYFQNSEKNIFIGGKLGPFESNLRTYYDLIPYGIVSKFVPMSTVSSLNTLEYTEESIDYWETILDHFDNRFPPINETKYSEETWEWTINRDLKDRLLDLSSYLLSVAIPMANENNRPLIEAVYFIESAHYFEGNDSTPTSLLKNLGLAHLHLVQNKLLSDNYLPKPKKDLFHTLKIMEWPEGR